MTWSFLVAGAVGVLIGIRFRVPTLLAISFAAAVASAVAMQFLGFSDLRTFLMTLCLVLILQGAYLIGLVLTILRHRSTFGRRPR